MQKAASLTKSSPMYSAPACSIMRKQLVDGLTEDTKTVFRMPTSPCGWVLSKPPHHNQSGGQLRLVWYVNSGWFRSNIGRRPPSFALLIFKPTDQCHGKIANSGCQIHD